MKSFSYKIVHVIRVQDKNYLSKSTLTFLVIMVSTRSDMVLSSILKNLQIMSQFALFVLDEA